MASAASISYLMASTFGGHEGQITKIFQDFPKYLTRVKYLTSAIFGSATRPLKSLKATFFKGLRGVCVISSVLFSIQIDTTAPYILQGN